MRKLVLILPVKGQILRTWGDGRWVKNGRILRTSFMDGPLPFCACEARAPASVLKGKPRVLMRGITGTSINFNHHDTFKCCLVLIKLNSSI